MSRLLVRRPSPLLADGELTHLDRVPVDHPAYPLALFKRAQVSVLLGEADRRRRLVPRNGADPETPNPNAGRQRLQHHGAPA